jgi:hypothetical protein
VPFLVVLCHVGVSTTQLLVAFFDAGLGLSYQNLNPSFFCALRFWKRQMHVQIRHASVIFIGACIINVLIGIGIIPPCGKKENGIKL